jgi:predicted nucleotidyltransferase
MVDLSFIQSIVHRRIVSDIYHETIRDDEIIGLLLQGSVARGDCYQTSDLDVLVLLKSGLNRPFLSEYRDNILVEIKYANFEQSVNNCKATPMGIYNFLDSVILFDHQGKLRQLRELAQNTFNQYQTTQSEIKSIAYWLQSSLIKIKAANKAEDELKASFVVSTTSWQLLEGVWAVNNKPIPPNGSVLFHLRDLERVPKNMAEKIKCLFTGNVKERIEAAIEVTEWTIGNLLTSNN